MWFSRDRYEPNRVPIYPPPTHLRQVSHTLMLGGRKHLTPFGFWLLQIKHGERKEFYYYYSRHLR